MAPVFALAIFLAVSLLSVHGFFSNTLPKSKSVETALKKMFDDDNDCMAAWPNVTHCVDWWVDNDDDLRYCLTNSIPPYPVQPYCPFGVGKGYCMTGLPSTILSSYIHHIYTCTSMKRNKS